MLRGMAERDSMCETLSTFKKPFLIIAGDEDKFISLDRVKEMASLMENSWIKVIQGAGHLPMLEKPNETAKALRSLIQRLNKKT